MLLLEKICHFPELQGIASFVLMKNLWGKSIKQPGTMERVVSSFGFLFELQAWVCLFSYSQVDNEIAWCLYKSDIFHNNLFLGRLREYA